MRFSKPEYEDEKTYQKIRLDKVFNLDFTKNPDLANKISQAIEDRMIERTLSGKDIKGTNFKAYSPSYKKSDEFKDFKTSSKVNMELKGDMLDSIDFTVSGNDLELFIDDNLQAKKSQNHNKGITVPKRQFFGFQKKELLEIKKEFSSELKAERKRIKDEQAATIAARTALINQIFSTDEGNDFLISLAGGFLDEI